MTGFKDVTIIAGDVINSVFGFSFFAISSLTVTHCHRVEFIKNYLEINLERLKTGISGVFKYGHLHGLVLNLSTGV